MKQVGRFRLLDTGEIEGPAQYFKEQGDAKLAKILAGDDLIFNTCCGQSPDMETAVLVSLQTDYAGWAGMQEAKGWLKAS